MGLTATLLAFFLLPLLAGGAVRTMHPPPGAMKVLLAFSGAFLLGVVVLHMLPELYLEAGAGIGLWLMGGFLLQVMLAFFSHGVEHGHMHVHRDHALPWVMLASLSIHSFVEGLPFADPDIHGDLPFLLGVLLHKMPMAVALAAVLWRSAAGPAANWLALVAFSAAAPLGILSGHGLGDGLGREFLHRALAVAIGMLLHISTTIIFEGAPEHRFNAGRFAAVVCGIALALLLAH